MASLSQGRTAAAQCGLFKHKSVPVIFEPPCISTIFLLPNQTFDVHGSVHRKRIFKYNQQDATLHNLFISVKCSTCFRRFLHPSLGAQNCIYSIGYFVKPLLLPATVSSNSSTTVAGSSKGAVYTVFELLMMGGGTV